MSEETFSDLVRRDTERHLLVAPTITVTGLPIKNLPRVDVRGRLSV